MVTEQYDFVSNFKGLTQLLSVCGSFHMIYIRFGDIEMYPPILQYINKPALLFHKQTL